MKTPNCFWLSRCDNSTIHHRESEWIYLTVSALRSKYGLAQRSKDSLLKQLITEGDVFMAINMPSIARLSLVTAKQNLRGFSLQISEDQSSLGYPRFVAACRTGFLHRHCYMPLEATVLAEREGYYTLSDKGIFTSLTNNNNLRLYIDGSLNNQNDLFLNPADCLMAAESRFQNNAEDFLIWLQQEGKYLPAVFRGRSVNNEQCLFAVPYDQYQPRTKESWVEFLSSRKTLQDPAKYFTTL